MGELWDPHHFGSHCITMLPTIFMCVTLPKYLYLVSSNPSDPNWSKQRREKNLVIMENLVKETRTYRSWTYSTFFAHPIPLSTIKTNPSSTWKTKANFLIAKETSMVRTTLRRDTNTRSQENNTMCIKPKINEVSLLWWGMGKHSQQLYL